MTAESEALWRRASQSIVTARMLTETDPAASVSRSYYAAFYSVSSLFAGQSHSFTKHKAVEVAVHRDLVRTGLVSNDVGDAYSQLCNLRSTADYDALAMLSSDDARACLEHATLVHEAIARLLHPPE